jgi:hypothetical protein
MTAQNVLENLAEECQTDHIGLWEIVDAVRNDLGSTNPADIRQQTLRLVRDLLCMRGMQVGHPAPDGRRFIAWALSPDEAVRRIEAEWLALGREPNIGEVAWFTCAEEPATQRPA